MFTKLSKQMLPVTLALCFYLIGPKPSSADSNELPNDLTEVPLSALLNLDLHITSAAYKEQKVTDSASAVFVLTNEDIRRSGATSVMEALRLVPGITVARINAREWAISSRGFGQEYTENLLVAIDGLSIFTPMMNGVYWQVYDLVLEDIDRIEVIRGSGAALWGANAMNGVINIITKHAKDTQGNLLSGLAGNKEQNGAYRWGGKVDDHTYYRASAKYSNYESEKWLNDGSAQDGWDIGSASFRLDTKTNPEDNIGVTGYSYNQSEDFFVNAPSATPPYSDTTTFTGDRNQKGVLLNSWWNHTISPTSEVRTSLGYTFENQDMKFLSFDRNTFDLDFRHRFSPYKAHDLMYGAAYRLYADDVQGSFLHDLDPERRTENQYTAFINDDITIIPNRLHFIAGVKVEQNSFTDFQYMPNTKAIWTPNDKDSVWVSISRSVSLPPRVYRDVIIPVEAYPDEQSGMALIPTMFGNDDVEPEDLLAYEIGYRSQLAPTLSWDIATFYNIYDNIISTETGEPYVGTLSGQTTPAIIVPLDFDNKLSGRTKGVEVALDWRPIDWWRGVVSYSVIDIHIEQGDSVDTSKIDLLEGGTPKNQVELRSLLDLTHNIEFDANFRFISRLGYANVPEYGELDLRLGWRPVRNFDISLVGQNLLHADHWENAGRVFPPPATGIERAGYLKLTWTF